MTLLNMPILKRLNSLKNKYTEVDINYFGSVSYSMLLISKIIGEFRANALSDKIDNIFQIKKLAFKFVLIAKV